jgi:FkbM family methyltransferase
MRRNIKSDSFTVLETKKGVKIAARQNSCDIKIIKEQFVNLQYFPGDVYPENFKPQVVLDIGGYIGDLSLYCASTFNSRVHCYEPTPQNFKVLEKNLSLNPTLNITAFNKGISGSSESIKLNVQDVSGEIHASSHKRYDNNATAIEIPCVSLSDAIDALKEPRIDLLKIDCEGQEFEILGNCDLEYLSSKVRYLVFEHHGFVENHRAKLTSLLHALERHFEIVRNAKRLCFLKSKR